MRSLILLATLSTALRAVPLTLTVPTLPAPSAAGFDQGTAITPSGTVLGLDSQSLLLDGRPWMPVMGEFHYSRYPQAEWRRELLKMKAGGIDIVATYVFWIHHQESEDTWNWSGDHDLRHFVQLCGEVGLKVAVRLGPWCHGEVRNGGIPDWVLDRGLKLRSDDPAYLALVRPLYGEIGAQLRGLLWKDGGPVIAVQLENEYGGPAEHLLTLKAIARDAGLDVPLYTRTGWPLLRTPMPFGKIVPLFGAYAEGFWDRELTSMPGRYWAAFQFLPVRTDSAIANEQLGQRAAEDEADAHRYPYLTCELGGGMVSSYHRRIAIDPIDIETVALVKIGSGGNLPGYYMYHGGINPEGRLSTLMEDQSTRLTNWNDMPSKDYDFYAPLGAYGQVRPHYHALRRLHLFARDFGPKLAPMRAVLPDQRPTGKDDTTTLRWSVRTDGVGGFVFVSNHQRGSVPTPKPDVQFAIHGTGNPITFPQDPITVPAGARFIWPFQFSLSPGVTLTYATAQLVTQIDTPEGRTVFFAATPGIDPELVFALDPTRIINTSGQRTSAHGETRIRAITPSRQPALTITPTEGPVLRVVMLSEADSLLLWKGPWAGRERVVLSQAAVTFEPEGLRLQAEDSPPRHIAVYPAVGSTPHAPDDGIFTTVALPWATRLPRTPKVVTLRPAGPARDIPLGKSLKPVAAQPVDRDFERAAAWTIQLPLPLDLRNDPLLRLQYRGDVARIHIGGRLVADHFADGRSFDLGLSRHAEALQKSGGILTVEILPLRPDAPIYLPENAKATGAEPVAEIENVSWVDRPQVLLN